MSRFRKLGERRGSVDATDALPMESIVVGVCRKAGWGEAYKNPSTPWSFLGRNGECKLNHSVSFKNISWKRITLTIRVYYRND